MLLWITDTAALQSASNREICDAFEYAWTCGADTSLLLAEMDRRGIVL